MDEIERTLLGWMVRGERMRQFRTVKAAKDAAEVNTATWNRVESYEKVRDDSLAAIVETLWPDSGGDYRQVLREMPAGEKAQILQDMAIELHQERYMLENQLHMHREMGSGPDEIDSLDVARMRTTRLLDRVLAARDRAAAEHNESVQLESTVGAQGKDADSLLYRRPDGVSDAEWERIRDQSRDYIEWLIEKAARER